MTNYEIIKALERCRYNNCGECSARELCRKDVHALDEICIDLINRQKAEIERLESRITALNDTNQMLIDSQEAYWRNRVKEFAERLKSRYFPNFCVGEPTAILTILTVRNIDNLVKEMTESEAK